MKTPDLTPAQLLATLKAAAAVAIAFGVPLTPTQQVALISLAGALGTVLVAADALIRRARAQHLAGPLADQAAATAIAAARKHTTVSTIATEAQADAEAQAANDAAAPAPVQPADGIDPATQT